MAMSRTISESALDFNFKLSAEAEAEEVSGSGRGSRRFKLGGRPQACLSRDTFTTSSLTDSEGRHVTCEVHNRMGHRRHAAGVTLPWPACHVMSGGRDKLGRVRANLSQSRTWDVTLRLVRTPGY